MSCGGGVFHHNLLLLLLLYHIGRAHGIIYVGTRTHTHTHSYAFRVLQVSKVYNLRVLKNVTLSSAPEYKAKEVMVLESTIWNVCVCVSYIYIRV